MKKQFILFATSIILSYLNLPINFTVVDVNHYDFPSCKDCDSKR